MYHEILSFDDPEAALSWRNGANPPARLAPLLHAGVARHFPRYADGTALSVCEPH